MRAVLWVRLCNAYIRLMFTAISWLTHGHFSASVDGVQLLCWLPGRFIQAPFLCPGAGAGGGAPGRRPPR